MLGVEARFDKLERRTNSAAASDSQKLHSRAVEVLSSGVPEKLPVSDPNCAVTLASVSETCERRRVYICTARGRMGGPETIDLRLELVCGGDQVYKLKAPETA
jgi:hypothetical protein